ncbi:MAG: hypothetical protein JWO86_4407 [Myxococcaceae bacterium]|nr:hypothetical protein [Myxococcaceae bacterium]
MRLRSLAFAPLLLASVAAIHCGGGTTNDKPLPNEAGAGEGGTTGEGGAGPDGGDTGNNPDAIGATTSSKVDLLLVVDNSASMGDKSKLLGMSLDPLVRKLATAGDVHIGVITSSLGTMGGDICLGGASGAHLSTVGPGGTQVAGAAQGFLAFGGGGSTNIDGLVADAQALVNGVGEGGCGLEAQLESMYRFLVQPDPWASATVDAQNQSKLVGIDDVLLAQRKAFLRPDSLVVVVMITDEDDSVADPLSVGGQGWAFMSKQFPGSPNFRADGQSTTAPRATSACATDPGSPDCTSCGFAATCNPSDPQCQKIKTDPECTRTGGYYGPTEEQLNIRFQRMKERYGIDPQYPISRYVDGLTKSKVPNQAGEHTIKPGASGQRDVGSYVGTATCTNPLFAAALPSSAGDELCHLPTGPRGKDLVVFALIGGVPESFAGASPDWAKILGADPGAYNYAGIDPHMIQSASARVGLPPPSATRGDNGTDPINGREWDTAANDLQYACTFELPTPRTCTAVDTSCDCADASRNPPLCSATFGQQVRGKAYPTVREMRVVKELGDRGILGSICPTNPASGYTGTMTTLADRLAPRIK